MADKKKLMGSLPNLPLSFEEDYLDIASRNEEISEKGGQGSGNWGHSGLAGVHGGSSPTTTAPKVSSEVEKISKAFEECASWYVSGRSGYNFDYIGDITDKGARGFITPDGLAFGSSKKTVVQNADHYGIARRVLDHSGVENKDALNSIYFLLESGFARFQPYALQVYLPVSRKMKSTLRDWIYEYGDDAVIEFRQKIPKGDGDKIETTRGFGSTEVALWYLDRNNLDREPPMSLRFKGGKGSGNYGHSGLAGVWGGSSSGESDNLNKIEKAFSKLCQELRWWEEISPEQDTLPSKMVGWISPKGSIYSGQGFVSHEYMGQSAVEEADIGKRYHHRDFINMGLARLVSLPDTIFVLDVKLPASKEIVSATKRILKETPFSDSVMYVASFFDKDGAYKTVHSRGEIEFYLRVNDFDREPPMSLRFKGGEGSGNWGHGGLEGVWGGSSPTVNTGKIPDISQDYLRSMTAGEQRSFHEEMRYQYGDEGKPKIADKLPRDFKGERFLVAPDGEVIYPDTGHHFRATHTQMYAYLALSGFENLSKSQMARAQRAMDTFEMEDPVLEGYFFDKGYISVTFLDITGSDRYNVPKREVSIKSHLPPNIKGVRQLKKILNIGIEGTTTKPMGSVNVVFDEGVRLMFDSFYDIDLLRGIRISSFGKSTPIFKERREEAIFKNRMKMIVGDRLSEWREKGGKGSGNWGHSGLAGVHGGSSPTKNLPSIPMDIFGKDREDGLAYQLLNRYGQKAKPSLADRLPVNYQGGRCIVTPDGKVIYPRVDAQFGASHTQMYAYLGVAGVENLTESEKKRAMDDLGTDEVEDEELEEIFFEKGYISVTLMDRHYDRETMVGVKTGLEPNVKALRALRKIENIGLEDCATHPIGRLFIYWKDHSYSEFPFNQLWQVRGFLTRGRSNPKPVFKEKSEEDTSFKGYMKGVVIEKLIEWQEKGGQGSGNWGHSGLAGVHGGSSSTTGGSTTVERIETAFRRNGNMTGSFAKRMNTEKDYSGTSRLSAWITPNGEMFGTTKSGDFVEFNHTAIAFDVLAMAGIDKKYGVISYMMKHGFVRVGISKDIFYIDAQLPMSSKAHKVVMKIFREMQPPAHATWASGFYDYDDEERGAYATSFGQTKWYLEQNSLEKEAPAVMAFRETTEKGGKGSGNWGHGGLDGVWGGSTPRKFGSTLAESNKHWAGTEADKIRLAFLKRAELHDERRSIFRKNLYNAQREIFDSVLNKAEFSDMLYDAEKQARSLLAMSNRDDFLDLVEVMDVKDRLEAEFEIWETAKLGGFANNADKDWARNHFQDKFNEPLQEFLKIVPKDTIWLGTNTMIETALKIGFDVTCYQPHADKIIIDPSSPSTIKSSYVHEFAHWLEGHSERSSKSGLPYMQEKALAFRDRRARESGIGKKWVENYGSNCFIDKFHNPYVGKVYNHNRFPFTEIISMGMEYLYSDPVGFAKTDPDYFNFTIDLLLGN